MPLKVFESYCFMKSTYTHVKTSTNHSRVAHPGVHGGALGFQISENEENAVYHNYYQWVGLLLVIQACICYLPWAWWKQTERGKVASLLVKVSKDPLTETPLVDQVAGLGNFLSNNSRWFDSCAVNLLLTQSLCLILTICQLYFMDLVLGNQFLHLGTHILSWEQLSVAMNRVFPLVVMCSMNYIGPSGEPVQEHGMCTLPINILNEKIYLLIWIWYLIMIIISVFSLLHELVLLLAPYLRQLTLQRNSQNIPAVQIRRMIRRCSYGDFILLQILAKNLDSTQFNALISHLCDAEINYQLTLPAHQLESYSADKSFRNNNNRVINKEV